MQVSDRLVDFLVAEEGLVTRAYRDVVGVLTIGVGHTSAAGGLQVKPGMEITRAQAIELLRTDLRKYLKDVTNKVNVAFTPAHEIEGATSFHFNTGAINRASWVGFWMAGEDQEAERRFKLWHKAGGKRIAGLVMRRAREADIIWRNIWPSAAARYSELENGDLTMLPLKPGDVTMLAQLDYLSSDAVSRANVFVATKLFQADHGLVEDGIIGPATRATLMRAVAARSATRAAAGSGALSVGGAAFADIGAQTGDMLTELLPLAIGLGVATAVLAGGWVWRNRGRFGGGHIMNHKLEITDA